MKTKQNNFKFILFISIKHFVFSLVLLPPTTGSAIKAFGWIGNDLAFMQISAFPNIKLK